MSLLVALATGLGGAAGALLRAWVGRFIRTGFPLATLLVNVSGSFLLAAALGGLDPSAEWTRALIGSGFCGALTTFSTFILELVLLVRSRRRLEAGAYLILTLGLCCLASWLAISLVT